MVLSNEIPTGAKLASYFIVSPATILIYDYLITFERELSLMWRSKGSAIKILFFATRYAPVFGVSAAFYHYFVPATSASACRTAILVSQWAFIVGVTASEAILFMRTWALWNRATKLAIFLGAGLFGAIVGTIVIGIRWATALVVSTDGDKSLAGRCYIDHQSSIFAAGFGILIAGETVVLVLTAVRLTQQYLLQRKQELPNNLVRVLYRDGMLYFVCIFLLAVINIVVKVTVKDITKDFFVPLQHVLQSILTARLLFNLRETAHEETTVQSLPGIAFARPVCVVTVAYGTKGEDRED